MTRHLSRRAALAGILSVMGTGLVAAADKVRRVGGINRDLGASVSVKDFGASGDGVRDDSVAILAAFNHIRTLGGGTVEFPNTGNTTYLASYGWLIPTNCSIKLNGCKIKATTTFGQGTIPANGTASSVFCIAGSLTLGATLTADTQNIAVLGGGAVIDLRYEEQTGIVPGTSGIMVITTGAPLVSSLWRTHDIIISDVQIKNSMFYGLYIQGSRDVLIENVVCDKPANLGFVIVSGDRITFNNCLGSYAQERVHGQGAGYWNEPNQTWETITNVVYNNCKAAFNKKSGFVVWGPGQDTKTSIKLNNCKAYKNFWDIVKATYTVGSPTASAGFYIAQGTGSAEFEIEFNNCVAEDEYGAGFRYNRVSTGTARQRVIYNSCIAARCGLINSLSQYYSAFSFTTSSGTATSPIILNNPTVIDASTQTVGYGIYFAHASGCSVNNPRFGRASGWKGANMVGQCPGRS